MSARYTVLVPVHMYQLKLIFLFLLYYYFHKLPLLTTAYVTVYRISHSYIAADQTEGFS